MDVAGWVIALVVVVGLLVLLDRLVAWGLLDLREPTRSRRPRNRGGAAGGSGMVAELIDVFQPSRTHTTEEQQRRRHDRQDAGDGAPPVDLDAGTAHVDAQPRRGGCG
ncbi:hypothetical protein FA014_02090 [Cellulomonas hominis]|uniref:Uncharacterized protein n=1 Tax=Cellulomonas hominis TaxID=156981 RepID=A0A7Z8K1R6_9CELL|nr:DUF6191 domain-containing protein [Cellulomonas hominis]TKR27170.1 hypothetical protein FA014_02090 [Cellulomonas hominis]